MGAEFAESNGKPNRATIEEARGTDGGSSPSTVATNTATSTSGNGSGGSGTGGTGGRTDTATSEKEKLSGLSLLNEDELNEYKTADETRKKAILKNARRRQQYAEKKANGGQSVKPRKVRAKSEPQPPAIDKASLNMVIASISSVIASRPNQEHWLLTESEINSITEPLAKMIAESESLKNVGQYSNQIALVMACFTIVMPRLIITVQKQKEVKKVERTGQRTDTTVKRLDGGGKGGNTSTPPASNPKSNRGNERSTSDNGSNNGEGLPWYGNAIC